MNRSGLLALAIAVALGGTAAAGTWADQVSFRHSSQTSIKVVTPEGFKVTVTMPDGGQKTGTVPELFTLPDTDAFVTVAITPTDGSAPWSKKIEVRSKQQTELAISFKADAKAEPAKAAGRSFVGRVANLGAGCGKTWDRSIKTEFLRKDDGASIKTVQIDSSKNVDVELPGAKYDVRVYFWDGAAWKFALTSEGHEIAKDGFTLGFGCPRGSKSPTFVEAGK